MKRRKFREGGSVERLAPDQSFKEAFREARSSGAGSFTWKGKKFNTELAKAKPAAPSNDDARDRRAKATPDTGDEVTRLASRHPQVSESSGAELPEFKRGGRVKAYAKGGMVRGCGAAIKGKTKGRMC